MLVFLDKIHQVVKGLGIVALVGLDADVIEVIADPLPWPALLDREAHDLPHTGTQSVYGGAELGASEQASGAVASNQCNGGLGLGARSEERRVGKGVDL